MSDAAAAAWIVSALFEAEWQAQQAAPESSVLDADTLGELVELAGDDHAFLTDLLSTYVEQAEELVAAAQEAAREGRGEDIGRAMHALNGSSRNMAAAGVARLCAAIEGDARNGANVTALLSSVERLRGPLQAVRTALRKNLHVRPECRVG